MAIGKVRNDAVTNMRDGRSQLGERMIVVIGHGEPSMMHGTVSASLPSLYDGRGMCDPKKYIRCRR